MYNEKKSMWNEKYLKNDLEQCGQILYQRTQYNAETIQSAAVKTQEA